MPVIARDVGRDVGQDTDPVATYLSAMGRVGRRTGRSTTQAAKSCQAKLARAGGWEQLTTAERIDLVAKARSYTSWLMVTGRLLADADVLAALTLRLGTAARTYLPDEHAWFAAAAQPMSLTDREIQEQWNLLAKIAVLTATMPSQVQDGQFLAAREALLAAYHRRGQPESGRNLAAVFSRLQLSLFNAGQLSTWRRPSKHTPVAVTGWDLVTPVMAQTCRRYVAQVTLSLRPNTVTHIEHDLRRFATWVTANHPDVSSCADLTRWHIEEFRTWLCTTPTVRTGKPLNRVSIKNALINLHCFFDRITDWGYPGAPTRPLLFIGDLPIIDKPLPRFLDDGAAVKLRRAVHAEQADVLSRLIVEILSRTGIRRSELLHLTVDAVVQIGSAYWLRIPIGKLHNDRYIPLHPELKTLLDAWIREHRPAALRTDRLLVEHHRPISEHRVTAALDHYAEQAGIGHVTAHQLRHTLATQAKVGGIASVGAFDGVEDCWCA